MIRMRNLQALQYVLSSRTITAAAELFGVTQSGMSRLIAQLEDEVGCQLLIRERGRIALTAEGMRFYKEVEAVLDSMRRLNSVASDLRHDTSGVLRIVSMPGLVNRLIPRAVAHFSALHPNIKVSIAVQNRGLMEKTIESNEFDIVLATLPVHAPRSIQVTTLATRPAICIVPTTHPLARRRSISVEDLSEDVPFVSFRRGSLLRERVDDLFNRLSIKRNLAFESHSAEIVCEMVAAGLGIAIIHPFIKVPDKGEFKAKPLRPKIMMEYAMLRPGTGQSAQHTERFAQMVVQEMSRGAGRRLSDAIA